MALQEKIDQSIALIRKAEKLALIMQPEVGFRVGFSGGKDSQVVLELVKMAGVNWPVCGKSLDVAGYCNKDFRKDRTPVHFKRIEK